MFLPSNITLQFGDSGDFVAELQRRLALVNCFDDAMVNGFYDGATVTGVSSFQSRNGLNVDGVAGPETLRRLNGVISGDTSSTSDNKKEEEAKAQEAAKAQFIQTQLAAEALNVAAQTTAPVREDVAPGSPAPGDPAPTQAAPGTPTEPARTERPPSIQDQIIRQENLEQQTTAAKSNNNDLLAQMLLQQPRQTTPEATQPAAHQRPQVQQLPPGSAPLDVPTPPVSQTPPVLSTPPVSVAPTPASVAPASVAPAAPEQPKGIVGRAMQMANSLIEKLGAYFESKLPPSVMNEVKTIGESLAKSGMKEAPIPTGPELPSRAQELPGRETTTAQGQTRN